MGDDLPVIFTNISSSIHFEVMNILDSDRNREKSFPELFDFHGKAWRQPVLEIDAEIHVGELKQEIAGAAQSWLCIGNQTSFICYMVEFSLLETSKIFDDALMILQADECFPFVVKDWLVGFLGAKSFECKFVTLCVVSGASSSERREIALLT